MIVLAGILMGCRAASKHMLAESAAKSSVEGAREAMLVGEYYRERKMAVELLKQHPEDPETERLMAEILDQEISREKEILKPIAEEELSDNQRADESKIWTDRAEAFLKIGYYEQALLAAERVFLYDSENVRASQLIDEIRRSAKQEGKSQKLELMNEKRSEIHERVAIYREQARAWIREKRWGAAKLTVEKILLLIPEDAEALEMLGMIRSHGRTIAA